MNAHELLPWFLNGTLTPEEHNAVKEALQAEPELAVEAARLQRWQQAMNARPWAIPPALSLPSPSTQSTVFPRQALLWGNLLVALVTFVVMLALLHPTLVTTWRVDTQVATVQVYRRPLGSTTARPVAAFEGLSAPARVRFADEWVWPGMAYLYWAEATLPDGRVVRSAPALVRAPLAPLAWAALDAFWLAALFTVWQKWKFLYTNLSNKKHQT